MRPLSRSPRSSRSLSRSVSRSRGRSRPLLTGALIGVLAVPLGFGGVLATTTAARAADFPSFAISTVASGFSIPWDVAEISANQRLVTERGGRIFLVRAGGEKHAVRMTNPVWAEGETGLMGIAVEKPFSETRRFYTCQGATRSGGGHEVRVVRWRLSSTLRSAVKERTLLTGLPATSGRHGGCRLLIVGTGASKGALLVGAGDAAVGTNPRDLDSLGGKVLRITRSGTPWPTNRYADSSLPRRYVLTYGHRNVQGLAQRSDGSLWSVEQGSSRDDEVNRLVTGGDYGWNPVPGYDESVPMTDQGLPGTQQAARWSSGSSTIATAGGTFVRGRAWKDLDGTLAVAALKGQRIVFMKFDGNGRLLWTKAPASLQKFGRLRSVTAGVGGYLYVTTSNGDNDRVIRVRAR